MKAKDYMMQVEKLDTIIRNKLVEKAQWMDISLGVTSQLGGEKVQSSGNQQKMANAIERCIDMEAEINALIDRLIDTKKDIIETIEQLNATEYDVLHKRYIQHLSYFDIAAIKDRDYNWVTTVHGRALKSVQRILDEREYDENCL